MDLAQAEAYHNYEISLYYQGCDLVKYTYTRQFP